MQQNIDCIHVMQTRRLLMCADFLSIVRMNRQQSIKTGLRARESHNSLCFACTLFIYTSVFIVLPVVVCTTFL